ncbi:hypothetical protein AB0H36_27855 [Kribbella sp. NPDC050820]|uniref:hypothetical protein n=1 Tax=Kribbella sp. NPDC050820 TaxID=3155408 RepID=UPI0033D38ECE
MDRFSAQRTLDGWVVVDLASAACTPDDLEQTDAESLAGELNARVAAGHHIDAVRWELPRPVQAATWRRAGTIDVWLYDKNSTQWVARVTDDTGRVEWCPGSDLRPLQPSTERPDEAGQVHTERLAG